MKKFQQHSNIKSHNHFETILSQNKHEQSMSNEFGSIMNSCIYEKGQEEKEGYRREESENCGMN